MARRFIGYLGLSALLCAASGCPEDGTGTSPTFLTWVTYSVDAPLSQFAARGTTLRHAIRVVEKAQLNAGVEFEALSEPAGLVATVSPSRLSETGRDSELVVTIPPGVAIGEYRVTVRARLTFTGGPAPDWYGQVYVIQVGSDSGFSLYCEPPELTLLPSQAQSLTCYVIREPGFTSEIDLSFAPFPEFLVVSPTSAHLASNEVGFAFTVSRRASVGAPPSYSLRSIGRGSGLEREFAVRILMTSALSSR
jgi:hypothetical protein